MPLIQLWNVIIFQTVLVHFVFDCDLFWYFNPNVCSRHSMTVFQWYLIWKQIMKTIDVCGIDDMKSLSVNRLSDYPFKQK